MSWLTGQTQTIDTEPQNQSEDITMKLILRQIELDEVIKKIRHLATSKGLTVQGYQNTLDEIKKLTDKT